MGMIIIWKREADISEVRIWNTEAVKNLISRHWTNLLGPRAIETLLSRWALLLCGAPALLKFNQIFVPDCRLVCGRSDEVIHWRDIGRTDYLSGVTILPALLSV